MSRQIIMHGKQLDVATPDEVARIVAELTSEPANLYTRERIAINLDAAGTAGANGQEVAVAPSDYDWRCERISVQAKAGAIVNFFENQVNGTDLLESVVIPASGFYSDSFSNELYVPANSAIIVSVTGGDVSGQLVGNMQIRMIQRPQPSASRKAA